MSNQYHSEQLESLIVNCPKHSLLVDCKCFQWEKDLRVLGSRSEAESWYTLRLQFRHNSFYRNLQWRDDPILTPVFPHTSPPLYDTPLWSSLSYALTVSCSLCDSNSYCLCRFHLHHRASALKVSFWLMVSGRSSLMNLFILALRSWAWSRTVIGPPMLGMLLSKNS